MSWRERESEKREERGREGGRGEWKVVIYLNGGTGTAGVVSAVLLPLVCYY